MTSTYGIRQLIDFVDLGKIRYFDPFSATRKKWIESKSGLQVVGNTSDMDSEPTTNLEVLKEI